MKSIPLILTCLLLALSAHSQPKAAAKAYRKAVAAFNKGDAGAGFAALRKSLAADSTHKPALYALGYYHFQTRQYDSARAAFDRLIRLHPADTAFYHYRALTHLYGGRYEPAERDLKHALSLDATDENTWNDLGYLYYQWGKPGEAAAAFDRSAALRPSRAAWYYKALLADDQNQPALARECLQKALQLDAAYPNALRLHAAFLAEDRQETQAAQVYERLLDAGEIEETDFTDWGLLYYRQRKYEDALHYFTLPDSATDANLLYYTGLAQYRLKKYPEALHSLQRATQGLDSLDEANAPIYYDRAILHYHAGQRPAALRDFFRAVYLMPEIVRQRNPDGDTLELLGNAVLLFNRLCTPRQLDSVQAAGYYDRADALLAADTADEHALQAADQVVRLDSADAESYFLRARVLYFLQRLPEALCDMHKVLALQKNNAGAYEHYWRGLVYSTMDAYDNALRDFDRAIQLDPSEPGYYSDRALVLSALGRNKDAVKDVNNAMQLEHEDTTHLLLIRASLHNDLGQHGQALKDCEAVLAKQPGNALAYCTRGYAYMGLYQPVRAKSDFDKALALDPDLDEARAGLEELEDQ